MDTIKRILSGITPSSTKGLHLGNYFGAVKPHIEFQKNGECFYFIANLHALNTVFDKKTIQENTNNIFIEYLAFGLNPEKTTFYVQSDIDGIPYLQTILNNVNTVAELKRMHGYKDKLAKGVDQDNINFGLFTYPVLMAADILIFKPDVVPVGEDQTQHVEIARDMAKTFNTRYGNILKVPDLYVKSEVSRVKGIDGERKMSKSLGNDIPIFGTEEEVRKQIMSITTDTNRIHANDPGDPEKNVTFEYLKLLDFDPTKLQEMKDKYETGNIRDVEIKEELFEIFIEYFREMRSKKQEYLKNLDYIEELRYRGAEKANNVANSVLDDVKKAVGVGFTTKLPLKPSKIKFEDFYKLDIRIGTIISAEKHPNADKLLKLVINFGEEKRQILAGIAEYKKLEDLIGKQIPVLFNLESRVMRGLESQGMIMAIDNSNGIALLHPEFTVENGSIVR